MIKNWPGFILGSFAFVSFATIFTVELPDGRALMGTLCVIIFVSGVVFGMSIKDDK